MASAPDQYAKYNGCPRLKRALGREVTCLDCPEKICWMDLSPLEVQKREAELALRSLDVLDVVPLP